MYLNQRDYVKYECSCGCFRKFCDLYFCRHCLELRCPYCLCHELDTHYCSNCMEHFSPSEAKLKRNRCGSCYDCPNCFHILSVRATNRTSDEPTKTPSKHYYLSCFFCRWTSRDAGIPDQTIASGNWPSKPHPHHDLLVSYLEYYKMVALKEKSQKDKKFNALPRRGYGSYSEKFGLTSMMARKRAGLPSLPSLPLSIKEKTMASLPVIRPCKASDQVTPLPESLFTQPPDLTKLTRLAQRHENPGLQAENLSELHPVNHHFFTKRSLRCKKCEHNVSKPEYTPTSIKFKIQLTANYHLPEVKIMTVEPLYAGKASDIILKFTNPMQHLTSIQLNPLPTKEEELLAKERKQTLQETVKDIPKLAPMDEEKSGHLWEKPIVNTIAELPTSPIVLPPRDDAAEYDDTVDTHQFQDDPKVVVWRRGNKAAIKFTITPSSELRGGAETYFGFSLDYGYVNTMSTNEQKLPQRVEITVKIIVSPGKIISSQK